jgi:hypothetical protein
MRFQPVIVALLQSNYLVKRMGSDAANTITEAQVSEQEAMFDVDQPWWDDDAN